MYTTDKPITRSEFQLLTFFNTKHKYFEFILDWYGSIIRATKIGISLSKSDSRAGLSRYYYNH